MSAGGVCSYMVHYISMDGFVYLTTTNREMSKGVVFAFLENLQRRYHPTHCAMVREHLEGCRFQGMFPPGNQLPEQWKVAMEAKPVLEALMVLPVHLSGTVSLSWISVVSLLSTRQSLMTNGGWRITKLSKRTGQ